MRTLLRLAVLVAASTLAVPGTACTVTAYGADAPAAPAPVAVTT